MALQAACCVNNHFSTQMVAVCRCTTVLLLCVLVTEIAVVAVEEAGSSAIRARGQGRTPNGKRRQVSRYIQGVLLNYLYKFLSQKLCLHIRNRFSYELQDLKTKTEYSALPYGTSKLLVIYIYLCPYTRTTGFQAD